MREGRSARRGADLWGCGAPCIRAGGAAANALFSRPARANLPRPTPQPAKKWRRVMSRESMGVVPALRGYAGPVAGALDHEILPPPFDRSQPEAPARSSES